MRPSIPAVLAVLLVACGQVSVAPDASAGGGGGGAGGGGGGAVAEDAGVLLDAGSEEDAGAAGSDGGYLAHCGSLFAARVVERQLEADPDFPEDCDAPLFTDIGALNSRNLAPLCIAGESANACRERVYLTPPPLAQLERGCGLATGCMKAKWVAACVDGTDACTVPDAVCIDGTRPLVYLEPATSAPADPNRWIIYLGGGGGPCQGAQCWANYRYQVENVFRRSLSTLHPDFLVNSTEQGTGLMLGAPGMPDAGNPMAAFNRVKWERCSSWSTDAVETVPFGDGAPAGIPDVSGPPVTRTSTTQVWHKGLPMARALFRSLTTVAGRDLDGDGMPDLPSLANATSIYLAGSSDAAAGLTWGADALAAELRAIAGPGVEVRILFDGYYPAGLENELRYQSSAPAGFNDFANTYRTGDACVLPDNGDGVANETCSNRNLLPGTSTDRTLADFLTRQGVAGDASCFATHGAGAWQCFDQQHVLNHHLGVPFTVVSDREDPVIGASRGFIADDPTYHWATPEVYGRRLLDEAHDLETFWATAAREEGAGAAPGARLMLRKERRGMAPWPAANHTHFDSNVKMRWRMSKCSARNAPPLLTVSIADLVFGSAPEAFIIEDAARAGAGPYWVTGDDCSAAPE